MTALLSHMWGCVRWPVPVATVWANAAATKTGRCRAAPGRVRGDSERLTGLYALSHAPSPQRIGARQRRRPGARPHASQRSRLLSAMPLHVGARYGHHRPTRPQPCSREADSGRRVWRNGERPSLEQGGLVQDANRCTLCDSLICMHNAARSRPNARIDAFCSSRAGVRARSDVARARMATTAVSTHAPRRECRSLHGPQRTALSIPRVPRKCGYDRDPA